MAKDYLRQSALAHLHLAALGVDDPDGAGVVLCERPFRGQLSLRGNSADHEFVEGVQGVLGVGAPLDPNTVNVAGNITVLWLGPNEWLIVTPDGQETELVERISDALAGQHFAVSDVSDSRAIIGLTGIHARDVLMKGCSLDLHPRAFNAGSCAQSSLARCHVLLHQINEIPTYDIYVHRSFSDYAWRWLEDAAREYGFAIINQSAIDVVTQRSTRKESPVSA
ncbi:MAG: sarcosine oxidase subunit gamma [Gammaproteobacteria bacterium]|jgi:sarcosine oxidase subunit gamma|nr:sarcosine oxidase subunit gamma [Gammaproteobacteria bacterium]